MTDIEKDFFYCISELVDIYARERALSREDLASSLGVREDYIRKIHSISSNRRYSSKHLFLLSETLKVSISELYPSVENLKKIEQYKSLSDVQREKIIKKFVEDLRKDEEDE